MYAILRSGSVFIALRFNLGPHTHRAHRDQPDFPDKFFCCCILFTIYFCLVHILYKIECAIAEIRCDGIPKPFIGMDPNNSLLSIWIRTNQTYRAKEIERERWRESEKKWKKVVNLALLLFNTIFFFVRLIHFIVSNPFIFTYWHVPMHRQRRTKCANKSLLEIFCSVRSSFRFIFVWNYIFSCGPGHTVRGKYIWIKYKVHINCVSKEFYIGNK